MKRSKRRDDLKITSLPKMTLLAFLGALILTSVGCTIHKVGTAAIRNDKTVAEVKSCQSAEQVQNLLGPPRRTDVLSNGFERLVYIYQESEENPWRHGHQFTLTVTVDNAGAVQHVELQEHEY